MSMGTECHRVSSNGEEQLGFWAKQHWKGAGGHLAYSSSLQWTLRRRGEGVNWPRFVVLAVCACSVAC